MKALIYIILILFLTTACKKETTVVIQAQNYLNPLDGSGYSGGSYRIVETESSFYTNPSEVIKTGFLDENGHASFDIKINNNKKNIVSISKPDNICYTEFLNQHLTDESSNTVNFKYAPCAYLKFILNNVNCNGVSDTVKYRRVAYGLIEEVQVDHQVIKSGCVNLEGDFFERPAGEYEYIWEVTKNNITTYHSETFTLTEGDSTIFQIDY